MIEQFVKDILEEAVNQEIHDVYFIPEEADYALYYRKGEHRHYMKSIPFETTVAVISHLKYVSGMNVGEKRRAQLGSCDYSLSSGVTISLRLSTVGDYRMFESLVVRLLYTKPEKLTFWYKSLNDIEQWIKGRGLYLFSGPVGSGKTTLMYELAKKKFKTGQIMAIEDPVEIKIPTILQLQVNEDIGSSYDNLIKLSLRHRPDCLIIGEIRDNETAQAVIRASLTGIMVFSTIHARSIRGVYSRLIELGVSQNELENCLQGIAYQRLIGGGGLIDLANEDYQEHHHDVWNQSIDQLWETGKISLETAKQEKIRD